MVQATTKQEVSGLSHRPRAEVFEGPRWRLGTVVVEGRPGTVIEIDDALYLLDEVIAKSGISAPAAPTGVRDLIDNWGIWRPLLAKLAGSSSDAGTLSLDRVEWLPAIPNPRKIVCVGINYHDHVAEMGGSAPTGRPFAFVKPENTLLGHRQTLRLPSIASMIDWEAELAIIIGKKAFGVSAEDAYSVVAGYCPFNDISARDWISQPTPVVGLDWICTSRSTVLVHWVRSLPQPNSCPIRRISPSGCRSTDRSSKTCRRQTWCSASVGSSSICLRS